MPSAICRALPRSRKFEPAGGTVRTGASREFPCVGPVARPALPHVAAHGGTRLASRDSPGHVVVVLSGMARARLRGRSCPGGAQPQRFGGLWTDTVAAHGQSRSHFL